MKLRHKALWFIFRVPLVCVRNSITVFREQSLKCEISIRWRHCDPANTNYGSTLATISTLRIPKYNNWNFCVETTHSYFSLTLGVRWLWPTASIEQHCFMLVLQRPLAGGLNHSHEMCGKCQLHFQDVIRLMIASHVCWPRTSHFRRSGVYDVLQHLIQRTISSNTRQRPNFEAENWKYDSEILVNLRKGETDTSVVTF